MWNLPTSFCWVFFVHPSEFSKSVTTVRLYNVKLSEVVHKYQLHVLYCRNNDNGWSCCAINREKVTFLKSFNRSIWYVYVFLWIFFKIYLWKKQNHTIVSSVWSIDWLIYCWLTSVNEYFIYSNYTVRMVALRFTFRKQTIEKLTMKNGKSGGRYESCIVCMRKSSRTSQNWTENVNMFILQYERAYGPILEIN